MTTFSRIAVLLASVGLAATPALAQTRAEQQRFDQAQQRYNNEQRIYRLEYDRYQQARSRSGYRDPRGGNANDPRYDSQNDSRYNDPRYSDSRGGDPRYNDPRYDDRAETGYDPSRYYRDGSGYQERTLSADDRVYRGTDGRYYCKRNDGTTGLIVGAIGGGVLGNVIDGGHSRGVGTILGAIAGGVVGKSVDQNNSQVRCR